MDLQVDCCDMPSNEALQAIVRSVKDSLPLTTKEQDLRLAIAKCAWLMAINWIKTRPTHEEKSR